MNERIQELVKEAGGRVNSVCHGHGDYRHELQLSDEQIENFAELIVRECSAVANHFSDGHEVRHFDDSKRYLYFVDIGKVVLEHFGVEE